MVSEVNPVRVAPNVIDTATSPLESLPDHLLRHISSFLDRGSAISLAQTSSCLQPYGEASAWKELNISLQRSYHLRALPYEWTRPIGGNRLYKVWQSYPYAPRVMGPGDQGHPSEALASFVGDLAGLLKARPAWVEAVHRISYDIDHLFSTEFIQLVTLVSPTLIGLELLPAPTSFPATPHLRLYDTDQFFCRLTAPLATLRHLHLTLDSDWETRVRTALPCTPNLLSIRLTPNVQFTAGWASHTTLTAAQELGGWPMLPSLKRLEVDNMSPVFVPFFMELVTAAPQLEVVALRDSFFTWNPSDQDTLLQTLSGLNQLKYLAVSSPCKGFLEWSEGFRSLQLLSMEEKDGTNRAAQIEVRVYSVRKAQANPGQAVDIPNLPQVRRIFAYCSLRSENIRSWCWGGIWASLPEPIRAIRPEILQKIHQAKNLEVIQSPGLVDNEHTEYDNEYWGSTRPAKNYDRFVLIRTYCSSDGIFTHCRSFSSQFCHVTDGDQRVHRAQDVWEEYTDYKGECVPANILSAVYTALDSNVGWAVPGRGLEFPNAASKVLQRWKGGTG